MIVRFNEYERYDIQQDCQVIRFMGVTNAGTYHAEFPVISSRQLRELRHQFKEAVVQRMQDGVEPQEIAL